MTKMRPDRNLALELVRVTEAAALAAGRWVGRGDKEAADQAAVDAMRLMIDTVAMDGVVVIGEGEKDEAPPEENVRRVGKALGKEPEDVAVIMLERDRHEALVKAVREVGARMLFITDGDVAGAILAASPNRQPDLLLGVGGTPEGVIAACALKCLGGNMQGKLWPRNEEERAA